MGASIPGSAPVRILLAEDDDSLGRILLNRLKRCGWEIEWVSRGLPAVQRATGGDFRLLILDFNLPDMTAMEIVERVRAQGCRVPFIVATGQGDEHVAVDMMKLGARDYLLKDNLLLERLPVVVSRVLREVETEHRAALLESRFRAAFEGASDALLLIEDGRVVDCNAAAEMLCGMSKRDLLGRRPGELSPLQQPDGGDSSALGETWMRAALASGSVRFEWMLRNQGGECIPVEILLSAFEFDGKRVLQAAVRDIRRRRAVEDALRESEWRFRQLFRASIAGIALHEMVCDESGTPVDYRFLEVNPAFEAMTGLKAARIVGRTVREVMPDTERSWIERFGLVAATGRPEHFEQFSSVLNKHFEVSAYAPQPGQFAATVSDVTERRRAADALARSEAELAAIYEHSPVVLCVIDENTRIVRANRAAAALCQSAPEQIVGMPVGVLLGCVQHAPEGPACVLPERCVGCPMCERLRETIRHGTTHRRVEIQAPGAGRGADDEVRWLCSFTRIALGGQNLALFTAEDVSELRRAESQARQQAALLDVASDAILLRNLEGRVTYWNQGAERLYGWSREEALGRTLGQLMYPEANDDVLAGAVRAVEECGAWAGELVQVDRSGRRLVVQSRWTLVRDDSGRPRSVLVVNTDATERTRLSEQLLRAQRLESVGTLTSGIAHDLNNVLSPIVMSLGLMRTFLRDSNALSLLATMEQCAYRGAGIVRQLLSFARGTDCSPVPIKPVTLVQETARIIRETFPRSIQVESGFGHDLGLITGDYVQLQQVLMNLCINARDAMPEGGTLVIRADSVRDLEQSGELRGRGTSPDLAVLTVSDTGEGIPPEHLDRIFDPFFTTKPAGSGSGLGLAIVHGIIAKHGGYVHVESIVGKGSTFRVFLPVNTRLDQDAVVEEPAPDIAHGNGETVLVVDDEATVRYVVTDALRRAGYSPIAAHDGAEAMVLLEDRGEDISLVIADLMMAGVDGLELLRHVRAWPHPPAVIAMTGMGEERYVSAAVEAGASLVLIKPFSAEKLLTSVHQNVGHRRRHATV